MEVEKQLEKDIKELEGKINKCKSTSMMRYYYNDMLQLINLLQTFKLNYGLKLMAPKELVDFTNKKNEFYESKQFDSNYKNNELTRLLALGSLKSYSDAQYGIGFIDYREQKFTDKDVKDIIMDFYTRYNPELYKWLRDFFNEKRIVLKKKLCDKYLGVCFFAPTIKKSYILSSGESNKLTVSEMSCIAHELGHALHCRFLETRYEQTFSSLYSNLLEFPSCTFEKMFLDFASQQEIDKKGAEIAIHETHDELFYQILNLIVINSIKNYDVDDDYNIDAQKEDIEKAYSDLSQFINWDFDSNELIPYRDSYIYGFGNLLGAHFSNIYLENPKEARKQIENIICNIGIMDDFTLLNNFSLNSKEIYEGKQLTKSLTRNQDALKKMNI